MEIKVIFIEIFFNQLTTQHETRFLVSLELRYYAAFFRVGVDVDAYVCNLGDTPTERERDVRSRT